MEADLSALSPVDLGGASPVDAVLSTATFHWVTDHDRLFANLHSVLRPGGQLVAQCGGAGNIASVIEAVRSLGVERAGTWLYASPEETTERLERLASASPRLVPPRAGDFPDRSSLVEFLGTVCLREHLATIPLPNDVPSPNTSRQPCRRL